MAERVNSKEISNEIQNDINDQLCVLNTNFPELVSLGVEFRKQQITSLKKGLKELQDEIIESQKKDQGMDSITSYTSHSFDLVGQADLMLDQLDDWVKPRRLDDTLLTLPSKSYVQAQPKGVYLIYGAWNFQYNLVLGP